MLTVLAGGVGAARLLSGLMQVHDPAQITAIVNVGDDLEMHGLAISPDLDTVVYTVAGAIDAARGWGLANETWHAMEALANYGGSSWFNLGDRDLGTHLFRTSARNGGATLAEVTAQIARSLGVAMRVIPVTNDPLHTRLTVRESGQVREIDFQEYFVRYAHALPVSAIRFVGADDAQPAPDVLGAIAHADRLVIAPSNPLVSIDPVLSVPGVREAVQRRRETTIAVSPIVAGAALKGPADRMLAEFGHEVSVVGIARIYRDLVSALVIDESDAALAGAVRDVGITPIVAPTIMSDAAKAAALGSVVINSVLQ